MAVQPRPQARGGDRGDRRGIGEHEFHPGCRQRRVDRQIGRPGLEHRQDRDDGLGRAGEQQRHTRTRARAISSQQVRQPVRRLVEFAVGPRVCPVADRDRAGVACHMVGKQRRNRHLRRRGPGQHRPVTHLIQTGVLTSVQHIDRRQPRLRIGRHRHQHPLEPLDEGLDGFPVEYVGAEFNHPPNPVGRIGIGPVFGQREGEVHAGGVGVDRHLGDLQVTQRQPGSGVAGVPGQVLPRQCHLNQRVMGQRSGGVEPLDEHLERHVLMLEGDQAAPTYLGQQLGNGGIARPRRPAAPEC